MLSWPRKESLDRLGPKKSVQAPVSERGRAEKALQGVASFRLALTALSCAPLPPLEHAAGTCSPCNPQTSLAQLEAPGALSGVTDELNKYVE